jgi:hypothetical protein
VRVCRVRGEAESGRFSETMSQKTLNPLRGDSACKDGIAALLRDLIVDLYGVEEVRHFDRDECLGLAPPHLHHTNDCHMPTHLSPQPSSKHIQMPTY